MWYFISIQSNALQCFSSFHKVAKSENEISEEEFFTAVCKFESKKSPMYNFLIKTGLKFRMSIFKLCNRFIQSEEFPSSFNLTTLIQLPKKGSQADLDNSRFIQMKHWMPRLCEAVTVGRMKEEILAAGTIFQIGGCPGQRTQFHLFVIKSLIALRTEEGGSVLLTAVDIRKFFDKQSLVDAMHTLYQAKVKSKWYKVWYKLNEKTTIEVRTGAGMSAQGLAGPVTLVYQVNI